jgi:putative ABC transport system ATP-binding protein
MTDMDILKLENISRSYLKNGRRVAVLKGISLSVRPKDFIIVQGPSGSGKTTLLLVCGGLLSPDAGRVILSGKDLYAASPEERAVLRASQVGFVFQQFHLVPYLDVIDNVLAACIGLKAEGDRERAVKLLKHFELSHRLKHYPSELSTGERQRVALARALFNKPKLILADEPTGNLDPKNAGAVIAYLKEFAGRGGAVLFITHSLRTAGPSKKIIKLKQRARI